MCIERNLMEIAQKVKGFYEITGISYGFITIQPEIFSICV